MQITTLGPLAVDGRPVRGDRLAAAVRELVDARGRVVSVAALVDAVWDGAPPEDAVGALQALVSRVRRLGLPVEAVAGGYRLAADRVRIDAVEARTLVERARTALRSGDVAAARRAADEARALFAAVPELGGAEPARLFAEVVVARAEAAVVALAARAEGSGAEESGAVGSGAVGTGATAQDEADLRHLVGYRPPHEPAVALLVRLLAAEGRDAEALEVVGQLRADLAERYGTDPSRIVTDVHLALLRGELAPARAPVGDARIGARPRRAAPASLPVSWRRAATPLLGRDRDLAAVERAVAAAPLVTIVATGGAGKTRLAAEVARRAAASGTPVRVVELAGLRSADEVVATVLAAIGGGETATSRSEASHADLAGPDDRLQLAAQDLDGLLVLDNCEHVLPAAAAVVADLLLVAAPTFGVVATSRAPLGLPAEFVHRLRMLSDDDALALIAARAATGGATLRWDAGRAIELCHRLDNLPLALELAAARLRHMPIDDVLSGLADRFALLDDALRGLPDRHASLWAMVDWSRELLGPADRELLQNLAVIPAPFTAELAEAVSRRADARAGLAVLVEQSLLSLTEAEVGPPRYRMLETVREYGEVRLDAAGGRDSAMAGLVGWAQAHAIALAGDFIGPGQVVALARCAADQDSLVAALRWAVAREDDAAAVDIAAALFHLWTVRGLHLEVIGWAEALLRTGDPAGYRRSAIVQGRRAGRALPNAERLAWTCMLIVVNSGITGIGPARIFVLARRAMRILFAERPDEVSPRASALALALPHLASTDWQVGLRAAAELIEDTDPLVRGFGFFARSLVFENEGQIDEAAADAELAYHHFEEVGDNWVMGLSAQNVAQRHVARGGDGAQEWLRRSERHLQLVGATEDAQSVRVLLDVQAALTGDTEAAGRLGDASDGTPLDELNRGHAQLGLAEFAWRQRRVEDLVGHATTITAIADNATIAVPQVRIYFRAAAASLYVRVAEAGAEPDAAVARAAELLQASREEALSALDMPVLASWTLAAAELCAHRADEKRATELWALARRLGASVVYQFQERYSDRLAAALAEQGGGESLVGWWRDRPISATLARIRELTADLSGSPS